MLAFSNSKINLGLNVVNKRKDGFHNIETCFYPIDYYDILEIIPNKKFELINKGIKINCEIENNLCYKAYKILETDYKISPIKIILYKNIPFGSGLGAGSSNAAYTLKLLNEIFKLKIEKEKLKEYAAEIGADCSFFINNTPCFATGKGEILEDININLENYEIKLFFSNISINTAIAYKNSVPAIPAINIKEILKMNINEWKKYLRNDFEKIVFKEFSILEKKKQEIYEMGAIYAQMSGSGSAIFGIFEKENS